ncbi:hypothetical protein K449DRAFT_394387 [Hypoxylon sp. EC38]|nr:hypothetical protein K449DRAFT_394387 [Hypoxylon sp. EC38]
MRWDTGHAIKLTLQVPKQTCNKIPEKEPFCPIKSYATSKSYPNRIASSCLGAENSIYTNISPSPRPGTLINFLPLSLQHPQHNPYNIATIYTTEAQGVEQPAQAADLNMAAPTPNPAHFLAVSELNTNTTRDILRRCDQLIDICEQTGDEIWLEERRLILLQSLAHFNTMIEHVTQCKNTIQAALDLEPRLQPEMPVDQDVPIHQEPPVVQDAPIDQAMPAHAEDPIDQGAPVDLAVAEELPAPPEPHGVDGKISYSWVEGTKLRYCLLYAGPPGLDPPSVFLGRRATRQLSINGWNVVGWVPRPGGGEVKHYVVKATRNNLTLLRQAYSSLLVHKSDLARELAMSKNLPLHGPQTNQLRHTQGRLLLRDVDRNGNEETRSALDGYKVELEYIRAEDLIFWVEEDTLCVFHALYQGVEENLNMSRH